MSVRLGAVGAVVRYALLALLLLAPAWFPLARPGLPDSTTGPLPVLKLYAFERGEGPVAGQSPDRWRGEGPWAYVVAEGGRVLGASGVTAVKFGAGLALALLVMAVGVWAGLMAGARAGVLAAVLLGLAPPVLGAVYGFGDFAALWVASGLALAALGLQVSTRWGWLLTGAGSLIALAALPGLGLWAVGVLLLLALADRRWAGAGAVLVGAAAGLVWSAPWTRALLPVQPAAGLQFHQLITPGWDWIADSAGLVTPAPAANYPLGLSLLGLLLIVIWLLAGRSRRPVRPWVVPLILGLLLALASLDSVSARVPLLPITVGAPRQLLLLALPLLAVAAVSALRFLPDLRQPALWAGLLLVIVLAAAPYLPPSFIESEIPESPVAVFGDGQILLLRLAREGTPAPGADVTVQADWLVLRPVEFDYNIFLHAVDATGATRSQIDTQPLNGERPMTTWRPGEIISDSYQLAIPAGAPADLHLSLGLYNWQTQERLPSNAGDSLDVP